jgi:saccharopepsin
VFQSGANPIFQFGAVGIVGLGLTGLSHIDAAVDQNGVTWGRSLLENIFALNTSSANYIAMALEREGDQASTVQGSLGVGEVAPQYANITSTAHIPLFPPQGSERWTVLLDSFAVNGVENTVTSSVTNVPDGHVSILLDSGTTYSYAGPAVASAIYSGISGAVLDSTSNQWQVPCSAGIRLTLWIAYVPIHAL